MDSIKIKYVGSSVCLLVYALLFSGTSFAGEPSDAQPPPEIVIDAPSPTQSPVKQAIERNETVTIYDSKVLPGFRPCTTEDYRKQDTDPVACQDEEASRVISTRESQSVSEDLIVEDNAVPQGNIFKLNFERFKKNK